MGNKFINVAIGVLLGIITVPIIVASLSTTRMPETTACAVQANTAFANFTITGTHYVYDFEGEFYCSTSATAPASTPTESATISKTTAAASPLVEFPGVESLLVIIPLGIVGGILFYATKSMRGKG